MAEESDGTASGRGFCELGTIVEGNVNVPCGGPTAGMLKAGVESVGMIAGNFTVVEAKGLGILESE